MENLSNSLKLRFLKDYSLPIQVVQEPYFTYYMETIDQHFNSLEKLKMLNEVLLELGDEESFFKEAEKIKTNIINDIQSTMVYKNLSNDKLDEYKLKSNLKQKDIYNLNNVNKSYISIDLKQANFNVLKLYSNDLVLNCDNYEELIGKYSKFDYFKKSKYIRQVIFGNLLPKKQQHLQKFLIEIIVNMLENKNIIDIKDIMSTSSDEIVISIKNTDVKKIENKIEEIKNILLENKLDTITKVEAFELNSIENKNYFIKNYIDGKIEFKAIPSYLFIQVYKKYLCKEITNFDKKFYFNGILATMDENVFEIKNENIIDENI